MEDSAYYNPRNGTQQYSLPTYSPNMNPASLSPFAYSHNTSQYNHAHIYNSHQSYGPIHPYAPFNHQNLMNRPSHQYDQGTSEALRELDPNAMSSSRSSSFSSPNYMDISYSHHSKSQSETIAFDENSNRTSSQDSSPQSNSSSFVQMRITDVESSLQNKKDRTTADGAVENTNETKDLSNNYVYRILMRTLRGKIELAKQRHFEEEMKERDSVVDESRGDEPQDDTLSNDTDDSDVETEGEDEVDDHDSEFDEYEVVINQLDRDRICDMIMDYEVDHNGFMLSRERYDFLGDSLVEVFIYEEKALWIGQNLEGVIKGRFPNKAKKLRKLATEWKLWTSPYSRRKKKPAVALNLDCLRYFNNKTEFDVEFYKKWDEYRAERIAFFKSASIPAITTEISGLLTLKGYELALNETHENLEQKWPLVAKKLYDVAKSIAIKSRYKKELKQLILVDNINAKDPEHIENVALIAIPCLLGAVQTTLKKKLAIGEKTWRTTVTEAQESFITHVDVKADLEEKEVEEEITNLKKLYAKHKLPLAPYVIACGSLKALTHSFVILDGFKYRVEGPKCLLKALDICYKCTSALYKRPSKPSANAWGLLRKYGLGEKIDVPANAVTSLISTLNTHRIKPVSKRSAPQKRKKRASHGAQKRAK